MSPLLAADWSDYVNPFSYLAGAAGKVAGDAWTLAMLSFWSAGLWLLRFVLELVDAFLTPDLREGGPGATVYRTTFWVAATLVLFMAMVQFGIAAFRRDGQSLARVAVGTAQFLMVWVAWLGYAALVLAACGGLTRAVMKATMGVDAWSQWQPWAAFSTKDVTDAAVATVLGILGLFLVLAAIGHLLVMLTRAGALLVLAATTPIAAAGLVSDAGRSWFWKSLRWFHAAALTPVLMALVMGVGIQLTTGVVTSQRGLRRCGGRHRRARGAAHPDRLLRPAGAVQDARVRRPRYQLRRRDAHRPGRPGRPAGPPSRRQQRRRRRRRGRRRAPTPTAARPARTPARTPPPHASPAPPAGSSARSARSGRPPPPRWAWPGR